MQGGRAAGRQQPDQRRDAAALPDALDVLRVAGAHGAQRDSGLLENGCRTAGRQQPDQRRDAAALSHAVPVAVVIVAQERDCACSRSVHSIRAAGRQQPDQGGDATALRQASPEERVHAPAMCAEADSVLRWGLVWHKFVKQLLAVARHGRRPVAHVSQGDSEQVSVADSKGTAHVMSADQCADAAWRMSYGAKLQVQKAYMRDDSSADMVNALPGGRACRHELGAHPNALAPGHQHATGVAASLRRTGMWMHG